VALDQPPTLNFRPPLVDQLPVSRLFALRLGAIAARPPRRGPDASV